MLVFVRLRRVLAGVFYVYMTLSMCVWYVVIEGSNIVNVSSIMHIQSVIMSSSSLRKCVGMGNEYQYARLHASISASLQGRVYLWIRRSVIYYRNS